MLLIFTLDDNNGTCLAGKRQSKDRVVADKIIEYANGRPIYMKADSADFFKDASETFSAHTVDTFDDLPSHAVVFAEEAISPSVMHQADEILVFRWNRIYPSLIRDRVSLTGWHKKTIGEFPGYSHEKITIERYTKT